MSKQRCFSTALILRDLVPAEAWEELTRFPGRHHLAGETLLRQGDSGTHVLAILRGMVKVVRTDADGKERLLAFRGPGEVLGEMAVQVDGARLASVRAISECEVSVVPAEAFRRFVTQHDLANQLAAHAVSRLREQTQTCEGDVDRRLAAALLRLIAVSGVRSFSLTREELGQHIGVSRCSITKVLERFGEQRVQAGRLYIEVIDEQYLHHVLARDTTRRVGHDALIGRPGPRS
ncbi:Crp/Fnr family transcriptional regulator [Streptomyces tubercidicus]|uniref:Crp/Fnr family transcriptional regulator n=1 Tax=Streptomyces tubercidicus TaxID=47759 RepID=A0A640UHP3_9ACTN|nr:Crp/Fnr family transcriptional regulator [Streptomyces tubercidicus]WAU10469.1 Crp/Fnr family transcriptional regulator [Streptomyces tubercidicus]GFE35568.1 Crp/Fnr family transcriptional regulator [Streptomyces tubercidicus]